MQAASNLILQNKKGRDLLIIPSFIAFSVALFMTTNIILIVTISTASIIVP